MSISFACPQCQAQVEVADEFAGHAGQCPRCQRVIAIPMTSSRPPKAVDVAPPPVEPRAESRPPPLPASSEEQPAPPRRAVPPQPFGPIWPWAVSVVAAMFVGLILLSSLLVLVFWRRPESPRPDLREIKGDAPIAANAKRLRFGRLEGPRAILQDGLFQILTEFVVDDPFDRLYPKSRCRAFQVELLANRDYVIELERRVFDSEIRLETFQENVLAVSRANREVGIARIHYRPFRTETLVVYVASRDEGLGNFTLTIRERDVVNPPAP